MQRALEDPAFATLEYDGMFGRSTFERSVGQFIFLDLIVHAWDLARATGGDEHLDEGAVDGLLEAIRPMDETFRTSEVMGPKLDPPEGADEQTRLLASVGRKDLVATARPTSYREWRPAAELSSRLVCTWAGRIGGGGEAYADAVLPDGCIDLVWDGDRVFVAGPDTGPVPITRRPGAFFVGARFRPGTARTVLGLPASELVDSRIDAGDLVGPVRAGELADRLAAAPTLRGAASVFEATLAGWLPGAPAPDGLVAAAVRALGSSPVAAVAAGLGVSERQLHRRCTAEVGYGPKTLARVLRFRRFLALAAAASPPPGGLAALAVSAGYADQSHLTHECRRLAGVAPGAILGRPIPTRP